jgi:hypothetical protein
LGFLIKADPNDFRNFIINTVIPFAYRGLGSVESLLNLKMYELKGIKNLISDDDLEKFFAMTHGIPVDLN